MPTAQNLLDDMLAANRIIDPIGKYDLKKAGLTNDFVAGEVLGLLNGINPLMKEIGLGADSRYLGGIDSRDGSVVLNKDKPMLGPTVLHEGIHKVQTVLFDEAAKSKDPAMKQFKDAYAKMQDAYKKESDRQNAIDDPKETPEMKRMAQYRFSPAERLAFGTNALFSDVGASGRAPHMDATALTDFLVLADMLGQTKKKTGTK